MSGPHQNVNSTTIDGVLSVLEGARSTGEGRWQACCPAHDDNKASLSIGRGDSQPIILFCHAGCAYKDIVAELQELGVQLSPKSSRDGKGIIEATYDYHNEDGSYAYSKIRSFPKRFWIGRRNESGRFSRGMGSVDPTLYRLVELVRTPLDEIVFIPEGEKDCDRLAGLGLIATTSPFGGGSGSKKWRQEFNESFKGRTVIILPDNDDAGQSYSDQVRVNLTAYAKKLAVLNLPGLGEKEDVSDWLRKGHTKEELLRLASNELAPKSTSTSTEEWGAPAPLAEDFSPKPFPRDVLPDWLSEWVEQTAEATQTPVDLPAMLSLGVCSAALAGKFQAVPREGWSEPLNLFVVVAMSSGERKSEVFRRALHPVFAHERAELERLRESIAESRTEQSILEGRAKSAESRASKASKEQYAALLQEARNAARDLAGHKPTIEPRLVVDDCTPEKLTQLIAEHGQKMFQASAEGTAFEIAAGRYSESPNFDVYLKGHAGDPLRSDRVSRSCDRADNPALTVAVCVQPDVIQGLREQSSMRSRGFLARFLYAMPASRVGARAVCPRPVSGPAKTSYDHRVTELWKTEPDTDEDTGRSKPYSLHFSKEADGELQEFERWLEPQLAEGERLSSLAGWANKAAGAAVRLSGVLHLADYGWRGNDDWKRPVSADCARRAIRLVKEYLLPHAIGAFELMGADEMIEKAVRVLKSISKAIRKKCEGSEHSETAPSVVTRRDLHQWNRRLFKKVEAIDPIIQILVEHEYLRPVGGDSSGPGRGKASPTYEVNPHLLQSSQA